MTPIQAREKLIKAFTAALLNGHIVSEDAIEAAAPNAAQHALKWAKSLEVDYRAGKQSAEQKK